MNGATIFYSNLAIAKDEHNRCLKYGKYDFDFLVLDYKLLMLNNNKKSFQMIKQTDNDGAIVLF